MIYFGAAYYPEHWPEERWPEDIRLMKEAGATVTRLAEFAWATMEPVEGQLDFDWLDRAIDLLVENDIDIVLGTPTATPPAWLTQKYPHTLAMDEYGRPAQHGLRCHYCVNSPEYHTLSRQIAGAMAQRYGQHPRVIGWQIDNEFNRICYCPRCQARFRRFLKEHYQTLDELNTRWSTAYWSQKYTDWEQIPFPSPTSGHNPGLLLELRRFVSDSYRRFQAVQIEALRPHLRDGAWITHNYMGWFDAFDHYTLAEDLDMASWDCYVRTGHHDRTTQAVVHDLTRGFKRKNFWLMETQPGHVNWASINNMLNKGEARVLAWQAIGHGADAVLYWQWRSAYGGQEQYHGTLIDQSGRPRPFYEEAQQLGKDLAAVADLLGGTEPAAQVAILNDYESRWSMSWQRQHRDFDYVTHLLNYYRPIAERNVPIDVISADASLDGYRLIIAPVLLIMDEKRAQALADFVKAGGHLILTVRCGMKDRANALLSARQPGPILAGIAGVEVADYNILDEPVPVGGGWLTGQSHQWAERLNVLDEDVSVIARFGKSNGWLDDQPAITVSSGHNGLLYYVGAYLDEEAQDVFIDHVLKTAKLKPPFDTPAGVEICPRTNAEGKTAYILINHERDRKVVSLPWKAQEHLGKQTIDGTLDLDAYGIAVVTKAN
ncbi:MAG: beta-galactosidase [Anaerolineae bacterium]|nr:beta-galactosidase [Anaerolineae bacterium]